MDAFPTLVEFYALIVLLNEFYQFNNKKIFKQLATLKFLTQSDL